MDTNRILSSMKGFIDHLIINRNDFINIKNASGF